MTDQIANSFLESLASSANNTEHDKHMDHISKNVRVYGVPGFEVIGYDDFLVCKSEAAARDQGKLRVEGKEYEVQDGDLMHFRFSV